MSRNFTTDTALISKRFEEAREKLFSYADYEQNHEFTVKNKILIDNTANRGIAGLIPYNGPDAPKDVGATLAAAARRYASAFTRIHLVVALVPVDADWTQVHGENKKEYEHMIQWVSKQEQPAEDSAHELISLRRQMSVYSKLFPDAGVDMSPTDYEKIIVADARLTNNQGQYVKALLKYIQDFGKKA